MKDKFDGALHFILFFGAIALYIFGVATAFYNSSTILAVMSLLFPPLGLIYGIGSILNLIISLF